MPVKKRSKMKTDATKSVESHRFCALSRQWAFLMRTLIHFMLSKKFKLGWHLVTYINCIALHTHTHTHTHTMSGTNRVSQYQKGKTNLDFTEARDSEWQWHQLGIRKSAPRSRQITMPTPHHSVFYRPDALPAAQPTASKHWRQKHWSSTRQLETATKAGLPVLLCWQDGNEIFHWHYFKTYSGMNVQAHVLIWSNSG